MCGIIGVISRRPTRPVPTHEHIVALLDRAVRSIGDAPLVASSLRDVDAQLKGFPGVSALVDRHELVSAITARLDQVDAFAASLEQALESSELTADEIERRG